MVCFATGFITPYTEDQQSVSQNRSLQTKAKQIPSNALPALHSWETGRKFHGWVFLSDRVSVCVRAGRSAQQPANQTPRTCLNGRIKLLGPGTADCVLFLLGARNSIIEAEQEAWCSREATRSTCACQCAKVNMQPTAHHASALAYRRRWLHKW